MKREVKRITRPLSERDRTRYQRLREQLELEKPELLELARKLKRQQDVANAELREACQLLKAEREKQGLSLTDIEQRTGISRSAISRLENGLSNNPTVSTLNRYAEALGKQLVISLADTFPAVAG
jgi:DNA-binding XRE family transcriptional regulator